MPKLKRYPKVEKSVFGLFLLLMLWLPIPLGSNRPWAWAILELTTFTLLIALVIFYSAAVFKSIRENRLVFILALLFIVAQAITIFPLPYQLVETLRPDRVLGVEQSVLPYLSMSFDVAQSKIALLKTVAYFCLFLLTLSLVTSTKRIKLLLLTLSLAGIVQATYGAFEVLLHTEESLIFKYNVSNIATGSFVYKNHYANYLVLTLSAALGYLIASSKFKQGSNSKREILKYWLDFILSKKALVRIGIVIMVIALIMSRSRMGNSAFFVAMTITSLLGLLLFKRKSRSYVYLFISLLVIDILVVSSIFGLSEVKQRIEQTSMEKETRDEVINDTLPILSQFMFIGSGGGTFYTLYPKVQNEKIQHFYDHAHNEYLQFATEFGWLASGILMILALICFATSINALRKRERQAYLGAAFTCTMAFIGMVMHSSVDFPLQAPANAATFMVILGIGLRSRKMGGKPH